MTDKSKGKKQEIRSSEKLQTKSGFSVKGKMKTILPDEEVKKVFKLQVWNTAIQANNEEPSILKDIYKSSSSEEEHMENALALGADEGRDKLRKATVSCK